ncbi:hypothetical protein [Rhodococcus sp. (in: high G+C Gram-positive bacteria)]|uniref:hypothetical protein n=1 Tax=Rhodococcus sp. TaxID=1831 RepID=UPI003B8A915D
MAVAASAVVAAPAGVGVVVEVVGEFADLVDQVDQVLPRGPWTGIAMSLSSTTSVMVRTDGACNWLRLLGRLSPAAAPAVATQH